MRSATTTQEPGYLRPDISGGGRPAALLGSADFARLTDPFRPELLAYCYLRDAVGGHRAHVVQVLRCTPAGVAHIVAFRTPDLFAAFGLPDRLPALPDAARRPADGAGRP
jgi:hypothetical protein